MHSIVASIAWRAFDCGDTRAKSSCRKHADAIPDFDIAIQRDPEDADAFFERGEAKREIGNLSGALADLDSAVTLGKREPQVYRLRAKVKA
jgi:tetratricopeptide (TPR) repeat protein